MNNILNSQNLFLAPLDGMTDGHFRHFLINDFAGFDFYMSEFLRIPSDVPIRDDFIIETFGEAIFHDENAKKKNILQILVSNRSSIEESVKKVANLGIQWIDLNCGCPSRTVVKNKGGSYLLRDLVDFESSLKRIRDNFPHFFSIKIRLGVEDTQEVFDLIPIIERVGVNALFIHGRTVEMGYRGLSDWNVIKEVKKNISIPVIGNGDILTHEHITNAFNEFLVDGVMIGRGALKTPWLGKKFNSHQFTVEDEKYEKLAFLNRFSYYLQKQKIIDENKLKRLKCLINFLFQREQVINLLRQQTFNEFMAIVDEELRTSEL